MAFIISGFGKFGQLASERLGHAFPQEELVIVDNDPHKLTTGPISNNMEKIATDAVGYLVERQDTLRHSESWIVPTVPFHLFARVALGILSDLRLAPLPAALSPLVPNTYRIDDATICCSYADFVCPNDCEEGPVCTVTGEARRPLHSVLKELVLHESRMQILVSRQLCPGIGGYTCRDLFECIADIDAGNTVIGTSCRCHAILTAVTRGNRIRDNVSLKEERCSDKP